MRARKRSSVSSDIDELENLTIFDTDTPRSLSGTRESPMQSVQEGSGCSPKRPRPTGTAVAPTAGPWFRQLQGMGIEIDPATTAIVPGRCSLPADLHPLVNSGIIHLAEAMYVEAVELLAAAQLQLPADPLVWLLQVEAQLKLQDAVAARALLSEMRSRLNRPHCWIVTADAELFMQNPRGAIGILQEALGYFQADESIWLSLGSVYEDLNLVAEAIKLYSLGMASLPASGQIRQAGETLVRNASQAPTSDVFLQGS